jgi:signal transduction histidine kinase/CheY-like chemotaxis protein
MLVLAPTGKDAALTKATFERAGIACECFPNLESLCAELEIGAAGVLLSEESVSHLRQDCLTEWLARQPPWSDIPILVLARPGADSAAVARAMDMLGNVTVLERPTRVAALVSAARTALRARQRQYQIRAYIAQHDRAAAALQDADRRKDEFLAILAHELRNPLAPIRNSLHIMRLTGAQDPVIARVGQMMERQVNHMVRLVDDLFEISRITRGKIELRKERVEIETVVRNALEASRPLIDAAGHALTLHIASAPLIVEADPVRLAQVIANLLNNAAKYTDPNGQISLTIAERDGGAVISVRDSGTGIPAEMLPRVFDLFTQFDQGTERAQGGLGIGLTLVKSLVELHGGVVSVTSAGRGQGSEFQVRLPLAARHAPNKVLSESPRDRQSFAGRCVLVVDDNRDAADSLAVLLQCIGADVHVAYSGAEALDALERCRPAVVLLDIGMPGMDGHEVARRLRQRSGFEHVTLVALTGWGQEDDMRRTREAGFDHHMVKPADIQTLTHLLFDTPGAGERAVPAPASNRHH